MHSSLRKGLTEYLSDIIVFSHHDHETMMSKYVIGKTIANFQFLGVSVILLVLILQHDFVYVHRHPIVGCLLCETERL
jgi:hypothetical protein